MHCQTERNNRIINLKVILTVKVMEKVNVFIVALPTFDGVVEKIKDAIEDRFDMPKFKKPCFCCDDEDEDDEFDFTPNRYKLKKPCGNTQPWGVGGKKADENLRFGYGLEVDEPMYQQYDDDCEFLEAREAFDDFVDAGERCRELGLERTNNAPITKCNAIRKPVGCPPPVNRDLIGESQFPWWKVDCDWNF